MDYYCKFCGIRNSMVQGLTAARCERHPEGRYAGKHVIYEGSVKSKYQCKYCGITNSTIQGLTAGTCQRHPEGQFEGRHEPLL